jgi:hypothetical protein
MLTITSRMRWADSKSPSSNSRAALATEICTAFSQKVFIWAMPNRSATTRSCSNWSVVAGGRVPQYRNANMRATVTGGSGASISNSSGIVSSVKLSANNDLKYRLRQARMT